MKLLYFFKINDSYKQAKNSLFFSTLVGIVSYILIVVYRIADPDTVIEGLTYYMNATWAIVGCGRWLLPIVNILTGNVIMPLFIVLFYIFAMWLSAFIIAKTWDLTKTSIITIIAMTMCVTPASISQLVATYMGVCFSLACLFSTLSVYLCFKSNSKFNILLAIVSIVCSLALYQSYISQVACLTLMTIIIYCFSQKDINDILIKIGKSILAILVGCILYFISNKIILFILKLNSSSRLADFSLSKIFANLFSKIIEMYSIYFTYFNDSILQRKFIYLLLFALIVLCLIIDFLKNKDIIYKVVELISLLLIPLSSNLIGIITPDNPITVLMTYQYILIIPFSIYLVCNTDIKYIKTLCLMLSVLLCWTHMISSNATYQCYKMSYDYTCNQYAQVIYDIQHNENYIKDKTPVVIAGFFDDDTLRKNIKTYDYSVELFDNLVFWETYGGATYNMQRFVLQYFGLDFIELSTEQYLSVINTDQFANMNLWPNSDGIQIINDYLVVKIGNNYAK